MARGSLEARISGYVALKNTTSDRGEARTILLEGDLMEDAAMILSRQGYNALFHHSGGGIMVVRIEVPEQDLLWQWGFSDADVGFDVMALNEDVPYQGCYSEELKDITCETETMRFVEAIKARMSQPIPSRDTWR
jgi:hypothetical protein